MNEVTGSRFLLIDDHEVVRNGIRLLLTENYQPLYIHEARNGETALQQLKQHPYDLVVMDIQMPDTDALGLMEFMNIRYPDTKVLIFSMNAENIYAKRFLKAGARGFISKDASMDEVLKAVNLVLSNRRYISEHLVDMLADETGPGNHLNPFEKLSSREFEIVRLLLAGETVSSISKLLNLQTSTVGTHKARLFQKLSVNNLLELKEMYEGFH